MKRGGLIKLRRLVNDFDPARREFLRAALGGALGLATAYLASRFTPIAHAEMFQPYIRSEIMVDENVLMLPFVRVFNIDGKVLALDEKGRPIAGPSMDHEKVFQSVIDYLGDTGGRVTLSKGTFEIGNIDVGNVAKGLIIEGQGSGIWGYGDATILRVNVENYNYGIRIHESSGIQIRDLAIHAVDSSGNPVTNDKAGILIEYVTSGASNKISLYQLNIRGFGIGIKAKYIGGSKYALTIRDSYISNSHPDTLPGKHGWSIWLEGVQGVLIEGCHFENIYIKEEVSPPAPSTASGTTNNVAVRDCRIELDLPLPDYAETNEAIRIETKKGSRTFIFDNIHFENFNTGWGGQIASILYIPKTCSAYPYVQLTNFTVAGCDNLVVLEKPDSGYVGVIFPVIGGGEHYITNTYIEVWSGETNITHKIVPIDGWWRYFEFREIVTFSGDGTTTTFTVNHTLWTRSGYPPKYVFAIPMSVDAASAPFAVISGTTSITIQYASSPPAGTNNIVLLVYAKRDPGWDKGW